MATQPVPQVPITKAGDYSKEGNIFTGIEDLFRFFQPRRLKVSKNSPPVLGVDITEGELVIDRTAARLYTVINNTLKYIAWT